MDILTLTTALSILALGYVAVPGIRRAVLVRRHGEPALPKRNLPPPLPQPVRLPPTSGPDLLALGRYRRYEAMGIAEEFVPARLWSSL